MDSRFALPANTVLDGAYRVARVVGTGGFGITYEAQDISLGITVALKEYYPDEFGDRDARMSVRPKSERHRKTFEWGRSNFLKEARTLARFEHPSIVRVTRVFETNSTAYMVMAFEKGQSLEVWLKGLGRAPTQEELDAIVAPLLGALQLMHASDFLHRDIAPDNIIVRPNGTPVLLDFGAARRAVAEMTRSLTGIVKAGYSPQEQYSTNNRLQGPWSDLYALGGTLYRAITGHPPEEATLRVDDDRVVPAALAAKGTYRAGFLAAIDACLKVKQSDRPRSVAQLQPILFGPAPQQLSGAELAGNAPRAPSAPPRSVNIGRIAPPNPTRRLTAIAAAVLAIAGGAYGGYEFMRWKPTGNAVPAASRTDAANLAQRESALQAERKQKETAGAIARQADLDAQKRRLEEEQRVAAEDAARRKADTEAERRRIAAREEVTAPAVPPHLKGPERPQGKLLKLTVKLGRQPNDTQNGWLGVEMETLDLPLALALGRTNADGVLLSKAAAGSPAVQSGLRVGDIVVGLDAKSVENVNDLRQRIAANAPGSDAMLEVWRFGEEGDFLRELRRLADAGNVNSEAALAIALMEGRGTAIDRQEGLRLLKTAADSGHIDAMNRLGHILIEGVLAEKDTSEGVRLLTKAAEAGHAPSMVDLGRMYSNAIGVQADPSKAAMWFKQAADLGHSGGTAGLGSLYEHGKGVEKDIAKAVSLYRQAADAGNAGAMTDLGLLHVQGKGVAKSDATAAGYFRKAATLGNSVAMNNLAWMLQRGLGVAKKDPEEAANLMMKALDHRYEFSHKQMTQSSQAWSKEFRQALQRKLRDAGYYSGQIDGEFREPTITAINAYMSRSR